MAVPEKRWDARKTPVTFKPRLKKTLRLSRPPPELGRMWSMELTGTIDCVKAVVSLKRLEQRKMTLCVGPGDRERVAVGVGDRERVALGVGDRERLAVGVRVLATQVGWFSGAVSVVAHL
jgi:hypothetical protein